MRIRTGKRQSHLQISSELADEAVLVNSKPNTHVHVSTVLTTTDVSVSTVTELPETRKRTPTTLC